MKASPATKGRRSRSGQRKVVAGAMRTVRAEPSHKRAGRDARHPPRFRDNTCPDVRSAESYADAEADMVDRALARREDSAHAGAFASPSATLINEERPVSASASYAAPAIAPVATRQTKHATSQPALAVQSLPRYIGTKSITRAAPAIAPIVAALAPPLIFPFSCLTSP